MNIIEKILLWAMGIVGTVGCISIITYLIVKPPTKPDSERARELTGVVSQYYLPKSFDLIYSRRYWDLLSANVCFIFKYPEGYYVISDTKYNYLNQNKNHEDEDFLFDFDNNIPNNEGCSKFISKLDDTEAKLFIEYDNHYVKYGSGRGSKVFINERDNLIMFEAYLFD